MTGVIVQPSTIEGHVRAPPSKSYTHRALVAGHLTERRYRVVNPLSADDTLATRRGLAKLGSRFELTPRTWTIFPAESDETSSRPARISCRDSGTTLRFLAAVASTHSEIVRLDGSAQLGRRPIGSLLRALRSGGARIRALSHRSVPLTVQGPIRSGDYRVDGAVSSQFTSALLLVLPTLDGPSTLRVDGPRVSEPYVAATIAVLRKHGVEVEGGNGCWPIEGAQRFSGRRFEIPGDASSVAYVWAAGALTGGAVEVEGIPVDLPQADTSVLAVLSECGARVRRRGDVVRVEGPVRDGFDVDLTGAPDLFPLLGVLAAYVPRASKIRGAPQVVHKESDRRVETIRLVRALGATARMGTSGLEVVGTRRPKPLHRITFGDHRVVMSAAVAALAGTAESSFSDAGAVRKSFPGFWSVIRGLGGKVRLHR